VLTTSADFPGIYVDLVKDAGMVHGNLRPTAVIKA
jgi:hypothetical protein